MRLLGGIDIKQGRPSSTVLCDYERMRPYEFSAGEWAERLMSKGVSGLHIVDTDGARRGGFKNINNVREIKKRVPHVYLEVGGGIRTTEQAERLFDEGVDRIFVGSIVFKEPNLFRQLIYRYGEKVIVMIDARGEEVQTGAWQQHTEIDVYQYAQQLIESGVTRLTYTDAQLDGTGNGPNLGVLEKLVTKFKLQNREPPISIFNVGGISTYQHLIDLQQIGVDGAILNKSLREGKLDPNKAYEILAHL
ncbi:MAG: geranylgeranylglyceryl/heptaprenylglyceryl phosphate synthase [bacterium]|nr:geranylgeranylglyceryl/heptaprenylglyceryl phosphate synthase [bacterium]